MYRTVFYGQSNDPIELESFPGCNGKTVSLGSQSAAGAGLCSWRYTGAVARFVNGQSIENDDDGSN